MSTAGQGVLAGRGTAARLAGQPDALLDRRPQAQAAAAGEGGQVTGAVSQPDDPARSTAGTAGTGDGSPLPAGDPDSPPTAPPGHYAADAGTQADSPRPGDGEHGPKWERAAALVRARVQDGTLRPGQPAPSGTALARQTGYSALTCRRALAALARDGTLTPGPSPRARLRVPAPSPAGRAPADAARALSAGLAARRHAAGLTQPALAALLGISLTTVGHAETGRLWQGRDFWRHADTALGAGGELLTLHDAYREATAQDGDAASQTETENAGAPPSPHSPAGAAQPPPGTRDSRDPPDLLTDDERHAIQDAGRLYTFIAACIVTHGPTRDDDLAEVRAAVHQIQHAVMAQAAARAYPRELRLLGAVITEGITTKQSTPVKETEQASDRGYGTGEQV